MREDTDAEAAVLVPDEPFPPIALQSICRRQPVIATTTVPPKHFPRLFSPSSLSHLLIALCSHVRWPHPPLRRDTRSSTQFASSAWTEGAK